MCTFGLAQSCNIQNLRDYGAKIYTYLMRAFITCSRILTIHKVRNFLVNKEIVGRNGVEIYKPWLIMARVRYSQNITRKCALA